MNTALKNKKIVITRDTGQAKGFAAAIERRGGIAVAFPTIKISEPDDWSECDRALRHIGNYDWLVFTSANGVRYCLKRAAKLGTGPLDQKIAVVGKKTAQELKRYGLSPHFIPQRFSAAQMLKQFARENIKGKRLIIFTTDIAGNELRKGLIELGARTEQVVCYRTVPNKDLDAGKMRQQIRDGTVDCFTFFSPSAFDFFLDIMGRNILEVIRSRNIAMAAIGPTTARAMEAQKIKVDILPPESTEEAMVEAIEKYLAYSRPAI